MRIIAAIFIGLFLSACSASFPSSGVVGEYDGLWTGELTGDKSFCQGLRFTGEIRYSFLIGTITQKGRDRGQISGPVAANGVLSSVDKIGFSGGNSVVQFDEDTAKGVWSRFSCSGQINLHRVGGDGVEIKELTRREYLLGKYETRLPICEVSLRQKIGSGAMELCKCQLQVMRDNLTVEELELLESKTSDVSEPSDEAYSVVGKLTVLRAKACGF